MVTEFAPKRMFGYRRTELTTTTITPIAYAHGELKITRIQAVNITGSPASITLHRAGTTSPFVFIPSTAIAANSAQNLLGTGGSIFLLPGETLYATASVANALIVYVDYETV